MFFIPKKILVGADRVFLIVFFIECLSDDGLYFVVFGLFEILFGFVVAE